MHEVSIVEGLVDLISAQKEKHAFTRVARIEIACGAHNCVSEETLNFYLKHVAEGTFLEQAQITLNRLPERWACQACGQEFIKEGAQARCPFCPGGKLVPRLNNEIYLDKLEVD